MYLYSYQINTQDIWPIYSLCWSAISGGTEDDNLVNTEINMQPKMKAFWIYNWMPWLTNFGEAFGGGDSVISQMYIDTMILTIGSWTWRPRSWELRDVLCGQGHVNWDIRLECEMKRVWRCTWALWLCELQGQEQVSLVMYLETVTVRTWRPWLSKNGGVLGGYQWEACSIVRLYSSVKANRNCGNMTWSLPFELWCINWIDFSHWELPGVCEWRQSVKLEASIAG
jgi:hypothetical protein